MTHHRKHWTQEEVDFLEEVGCLYNEETGEYEEADHMFILSKIVHKKSKVVLYEKRETRESSPVVYSTFRDLVTCLYPD